MTVSENAIGSAKNAERGRRVSVALHGGEIVERVVWEVVGDAVYLCTDRVYDQLLAGDGQNQPVGFPAADVRWN